MVFFWSCLAGVLTSLFVPPYYVHYPKMTFHPQSYRLKLAEDATGIIIRNNQIVCDVVLVKRVGKYALYLTADSCIQPNEGLVMPRHSLETLTFNPVYQGNGVSVVLSASLGERPIDFSKRLRRGYTLQDKPGSPVLSRHNRLVGLLVKGKPQPIPQSLRKFLKGFAD